jgi:hypothetical protein
MFGSLGWGIAMFIVRIIAYFEFSSLPKNPVFGTWYYLPNKKGSTRYQMQLKNVLKII